MKAKELLGYTIQDLKKRGTDLAKDLFNLRMQNVSKSLENTAKIRDVRRDMARVKTVINQKIRETPTENVEKGK